MARLVLILLIVTSTLPALAGEMLPAYAADQQQAAVATSLPTQKQRLDSLFSDLKRERDADKARELSDRIRSEWQDSGSASVNVLMLWAAKATQEGHQPNALDIYDQVISLSPDYIEGWNQRATLNYMLGNYRKSMSDINHVLALEPRHFGALAGMAAILEGAGQDELALKAWERFLDVYPADRKAQEQVGTLEEKLAGNRT